MRSSRRGLRRLLQLLDDRLARIGQGGVDRVLRAAHGAAQIDARVHAAHGGSLERALALPPRLSPHQRKGWDRRVVHIEAVPAARPLSRFGEESGLSSVAPPDGIGDLITQLEAYA
jgi:hypothetical protein